MLLLLKYIICKFNELMDDISGEYRFSVKGYEVIATFSEKANEDIFLRIKEILLGDSHIRQSGTPDIKIKAKIKEAV